MSSPDKDNPVLPVLPGAETAAASPIPDPDSRVGVRRVLGAPAILSSRDVRQMREMIERDYGAWTRHIFPFFGLAESQGAPCEGDVPPPSLDQVLRAFSHEQLALAQRSMTRPAFTLAPITSFERFRDAIDGSRLKGTPINVNDACRRRLAQLEQDRGIQSRISRYELAIDEAGPAPLPGLEDLVSATDDFSVGDRLVAWARKNYPHGLRIASLYRFLALQMRAAKEGALLNADDTFSVLVSDSTEVRESSEIFGGGCVNGILGIGFCDINHGESTMQIRPSIVSDVALIG